MRMIATLQEPDEGSILLGDLDVLRQKDRVRQTLGYLPQEFGRYPHVSAENLLGLLRQVNLWDVRTQTLGGYSGGMRQRFGVAVAWGSFFMDRVSG